MTQATPSFAISLDMNTERITGALVNRDGTLDALHSAPTPVQDGTDIVVDTVIVLCQRLLEEVGRPVAGIGISTTGLVHHRDGIILHTSQEFETLRGVPLAQKVSDAVGLPTHVENNVNAMAITETYLGAGRQANTMFYVYADATLNGAIIQDKSIWHGRHYSAGQIGQLIAGWMSTKPVYLSEKASGEGIAAEYGMRSRKFRVPAIQDILQFAQHGDQLGIRVVRDGAVLLASVLSPVISLIDPDTVIIGGILAKHSDLWWENFVQTLRESPLPSLKEVIVERGTVQDNTALIGAALLVLESTGDSSSRLTQDT